MKLSVWAKKQGIGYVTAWRKWKAGKLPVAARQLPTGTIIVEEQQEDNGAETAAVVLYARVSSSDQKGDLDRQLARLVDYATTQGYRVKGAIKETGSGLNGRRSRLLSILNDPAIKTIVVEHRDRLVRFGFEYLEAVLRSSGRRVVVMDETEMQDDLVQDMLDVLTSFCARLYGRRSARRRARKALKEIERG